MTEIPEHLLKRAQQAREKAAGAKAAGAGSDAADSGADDGETIPRDLLEQSQQPGGAAAAAAPAAGGGAVAQAVPPVTQAAGGHTQRLLTVVKAGSIQDVKAKPVDKVHVWPHLLVIEFVSALAITAFLLVFSVWVNAPLLRLANFNLTPNPSKAPWYFLGLQELLTMFHPMVAGVTIPGMGIFALMLAPYTDRNPSQRPEDRKFAIALFTVHLMFWAVLVIIGSFFRGPGFNFTLPWRDGIFFEL